MDFYYFNKEVDSNGFHEVHNSSCAYLPDKNNRLYIGLFNSCKDAIDIAKCIYPNEKFINDKIEEDQDLL